MREYRIFLAERDVQSPLDFSSTGVIRPRCANPVQVRCLRLQARSDWLPVLHHELAGSLPPNSDLAGAALEYFVAKRKSCAIALNELSRNLSLVPLFCIIW